MVWRVNEYRVTGFALAFSARSSLEAVCSLPVCLHAMLKLVVLAGLLALCAAQPARPNIPETFTAEVCLCSNCFARLFILHYFSFSIRPRSTVKRPCSEKVPRHVDTRSDKGLVVVTTRAISERNVIIYRNVINFKGY